MKKLLILLLLLIPFNVGAKTDAINIVPETIEEACQKEKISYTNTSYNLAVDDNKPTIYLFRGQGCGHCHELIKFLNDSLEENGKYFNIVIYEVWNNTGNLELLHKVASILNEDVKGVPYLVIGDYVFNGYINNDSFNIPIISRIKKLYESDNAYDVMKHLEDKEETKEDKEEAKENTSTKTYGKNEKDISWYIEGGICLVLVIIIIIYIRSEIKKTKAYN